MALIDETTKWVFPDVRYLVEDNISDNGYINHELYLRDQIDKLNKVVEEKQQEIVTQQALINELNDQINTLNESRCLLVNNINRDMSRIFSKINSDALSIIKVVVKKVIQHEIKTDDTLICNLIEKTIAKLGLDGTINVQVSEFDYKILRDHELASTLKLSINKSLNPGDIAIFSNTGGYMMKLDEVINSILSG